MKYRYILKIFILGWLVFSCESPLKSPDKDEDVFNLIHDFQGGFRLFEKKPITLNWSQITFTEFEKYSVHRSVMEDGVEVWTKRIEITDPLQMTYTDTLDDDRIFRYKVLIEANDGSFQEATTEQITIRTTSIIVSNEVQCLQKAYDSPFIDDGDTIFVNLPESCTVTGTLNFIGKDVMIISIMGKEETVVERRGVILTMNRGIISGFTFKKGRIELFGTAEMTNCIVSDALPVGPNAALTVKDSAIVRNCLIAHNYNIEFLGSGGEGAGILLKDNASVINCRITGNVVSEKGGGVFIEGQPTLINCIIDNNIAGNGGGGLFVSLGSEPGLVNCVIYSNSSGLDEGESGAVLVEKHATFNMLNSIIWQNSSNSSEDRIWTNSSYCNIQHYNSGEGNISTPPLFIDPESGDFRLSPDSPCVNAGNPGDGYNDVDGSRNDMGAYGGPYGDW